ncbi:MAG: N-acetylmuramoyl-L-alanine amidase [Gemmatimonadetes bacterium]|nr:N-acetylmuramoyl-L-alanine amidase [Gemmatimonadota bacterium]
MEHPFETDQWPVIRARDFTHVTEKRKVRVIVIHSMEAPESAKTAENVARYFQEPDYSSSAHLCIDSDSIVQCVYDNDVAFAAPGANHDGIQLELAGYASQTPQQWLDPYGILLLNNAANAAAQYCLKYDIPVRRLTNAQLGDGTSKGIVSHSQVSEVFRKSDHMDPGKGFPWDHFLERVAFHRAARLKKLGGG